MGTPTVMPSIYKIEASNFCMMSYKKFNSIQLLVFIFGIVLSMLGDNTKISVAPRSQLSWEEFNPSNGAMGWEIKEGITWHRDCVLDLN